MIFQAGLHEYLTFCPNKLSGEVDAKAFFLHRTLFATA
jgi:hypothetical protein